MAAVFQQGSLEQAARAGSGKFKLARRCPRCTFGIILSMVFCERFKLSAPRFRRFLLAGGIFMGAIASAPAWAGDYLREVKPLLAEHCYRCHGASQQKGGLRLDTAAHALKGGETGPAFKTGDPEGSLMVQALKGAHDSISRMPYKKPPLAEGQIQLIEQWIGEGAAAPADEAPESARHWAFISPARAELPSLKHGAAPDHPIDRFIQARLEKEGIRPAPEADRATLLRRLALDFTGLPPAPEEAGEFVNDKRGDAFERQIERLLASPHYGERWGRWWLDAARYGDSNGYSIDAPRQIWKYRDWVIVALNRDLPFDQFAMEQLAGDLLPDAEVAQKIATGFNRNTQINQEGGIDPEQFRVESVMDRVNTFGTVFLGLTVGCAQCHDHKFDPISQREYYQLYAFFNSTEEDGHGKGSPDGVLQVPGEFEPLESIDKELGEAKGDLDRYLNTHGAKAATWEQSLPEDKRSAQSAEWQAAVKIPWNERTLAQKRLTYTAFRPDDTDFKGRNAKLEKLEKREPKPVTTLVMRELAKPRETVRFINGDFTRPAEKVAPGTLGVLHPLPEVEGRELNRIDLARWAVSPANPLLARVIVNRVWQQYFGRGLVETENDFGTQGSTPSHSELLDWLACEFMQPSALPGEANPAPWSLKHLHRLIVTSAAYRQTSRARPELAVVDPNNRLLARQSRLRLDAEIIRDLALSASGQLSPEIGGPPVFPPQPDGVMSLGQVRREWKASTGPARFRRAIYTHYWRATPHPALAVFDAPDGFSACTRRLRSNTPLQALTLLNDQQYYEFAQALARRLGENPGGSDDAKIERAFQLCLSRNPSELERERLKKLIEEEPGEKWVALARVVLNLDETITRE